MATTLIYVALLLTILVYFYRNLLSQNRKSETKTLQQNQNKGFPPLKSNPTDSMMSQTDKLPVFCLLKINCINMSSWSQNVFVYVLVFSVLTFVWWAVKCGGNCSKISVLARKKGKVVECKLGKIFIGINDFAVGKELFQNAALCARPSNELLKIYTNETVGSGIIMNSGQNWKDNRKFSHQRLKQFRFGTNSMESLIQQEINDLLEKWSAKGGQTFSPNKDFYIPVLSSLWVLLVGERVPTQDTQLISILLDFFVAFRKLMNIPEMVLISTNLKLSTLNRISKWIPKFPGIIEMQQVSKKFRAYYSQIIEAKKETHNYEETSSNLQDHYLVKLKKTTDIHSIFFGENGENNLIQIIADFIVGGGDTTANMLSWGMLHLIRNPVVQENIRKEIDAQVGKDRQPCLEDIPNCPYTFAFILELLRFSPVAVASLPHVTTEDINVGPYFFRKNIYIFLNIYYIHHDPLIWGDPENFRPERFLSADGKTVVKNEAMCIFSVGQRRCVGEQVAYNNLFLFISSVCQRFVLHPDPSLKQRPSLKGENTALFIPKTFHMVAEDRCT